MASNVISSCRSGTPKKMKKLDAICAKLQQIGGENNVLHSSHCNGRVSSPVSFLNDTVSETESNTTKTKDQTATTQSGTKNSANETKGNTDTASRLNGIQKEVDKDANDDFQAVGLASDDLHEDPIRDELKQIKAGSGNSQIKSCANVDRLDTVSPTCSINTTISSQSGSSSRRKRRKALNPQNIVNIKDFDADEKDELADYRINNLYTEFPPSDDVPCVDGSSVLEDSFDIESDANLCIEKQNAKGREPSNSSSNLPKTPRKPRKPQVVMPANVGSMPLDLTVNKAENKSESKDGQSSQVSDTADAENLSLNSSKNSANSSSLDSPKVEQQEILKDYAENTMNELISMYGFGHARNFTNLRKTAKVLTAADVSQAMMPNNLKMAFMLANSCPPSDSPATLDSCSMHSDESRDTDISQNQKEEMTLTKGKFLNQDGMKTDKFTNSAAYINAVFNKQAKGDNSLINKHMLPDYSKYLKRYSNGSDCQIQYCKDLGYREHYHCMDCNFRVFIKKEEMVRHFKWHRKREDSLQHGFMRYSPMDDCSIKFGSCTHNGRQTHYHCLQESCDKVYISTSDVQMHANYHRKDSAIIQEGFQRFRATEDCGTPSCAFYAQRTTHFHCRRHGCNFTFKNKADMEKHKTYHQKDEILGKDGFKKFMKYEHCGYMGCRYSKVSNHIHCIRPGCNYVLHSTAQLYSHKRKHERRDFETAYRKYKEDQPDSDNSMSSLMTSTSLSLPGTPSFPFKNGQLLSTPGPGWKREGGDCDLSPSPKKCRAEGMSLPVAIKHESMDSDDSLGYTPSRDSSDFGDAMEGQQPMKMEPDQGVGDSRVQLTENSPLFKYASKLTGEKLDSSLTLPIPMYSNAIGMTTGTLSTSKDSDPVTISPSSLSPKVNSFPVPSKTAIMEKKERDESWKNYLVRFTANDPCNSRCQYLYKDHYHCKVDGCLVLFKSKDGVREHARFHELQDRITPVAYNCYPENEECPFNCSQSKKNLHYHCIWSGCNHIVPSNGPTFARLEHYRIHEYARASQGKTHKHTLNSKGEESTRRRGRPPKYPKINIPVIPKVELTEEEIAESTLSSNAENGIINGFKKFEKGDKCPDQMCMYYLKLHYHCARPRCHHVTDRLDVLNLHAKDFHNFVNIIEGFEFFDRNVNCRRAHCHNNRVNKHFHCVKPKCDYSFVRHSTMIQHDKKHKALESDVRGIPPTDGAHMGFIPILPADAKVKTSGTFFPVSNSASQQHSVILTSQALALSRNEGTVGAIAIPVITATTSSAVLTASTAIHPLSLIKHKGGQVSASEWQVFLDQMHISINQICGRPFCKLKKKDHFHCYECDNAFSDAIRLRSHVTKHGVRFMKEEPDDSIMTPITIAPLPMLKSTSPSPSEDKTQAKTETSDDEELHVPPEGGYEYQDVDDEGIPDDDLNKSSSLNLEFSTFSNMIAKAQKTHNTDLDSAADENSQDQNDGQLDTSFGQDSQLVIDEGNSLDIHSEDDASLGTMDSGTFARKSGRRRTATRHEDFIDSSAAVIKPKKHVGRSIGASPSFSSKDDTIPDGYIRIKQKEDCGFAKCAYRGGVTHFHCIREDCGYSFSDRSRLIQHTLRHERIDSLTGGELRQYRMNQSCGREGCDYQGKASHFHCLSCDYCCTDSSKVLTHRKHHAKMNTITSQGFTKVSVDEDCNVFGCQYKNKQTHYHCIQEPCNYAVLGPAQMASHKLKHAI